MGSFFKKIGAFSVGPLAGAVISFITVPLITHFISPEEYGRAGMFSLAQSTISTLMYLGMDQAFVREFNAYKSDMKKLLANAMIVPVMVSITVSLLIVAFEKPISVILFDSSEFLAVIALAIVLPFMVIENFSFLKIRMEERGLIYSSFTILLKVFILGFTVILFLLYEKSFRSVVYAAVLGEILNSVILYLLVLKKDWNPLFGLDSDLIKRMLRFGLPLIPAFAIGWILTSMDKVMLRSLCTYEELGLYTAAFKIVSVLSVLQSCFTLVWAPIAYRWYEEKKPNSLFDAVGQVVALVMTLMCLCILLFKNLVGVILGGDFVSAIEIFPFLLLYPVLYTVSEATAMGIGFMRKTGYTVFTSAVSGIGNIALNWLLIPRLGGVGAAIATGLSYIIFFWSRTLISRHLWYKMEIKSYAIMIALILINCLLHTFKTGLISYAVSIISIILVIIMVILYNKKTNFVRGLKDGSIYQ